MATPVVDPFGAGVDAALPSVARALDPVEAQRELRRRLDIGRAGLELLAIRVIRHKLGRRCMIEYDLSIGEPGRPREPLTAIGKVRVRRFGKSGFRLLDALWRSGFDAGSPDGVSVPQPLGTVSAFRMWLQRKVAGRLATDLVAGPGAEALARRVAEAACKLHRAGVPPERRHGIADELRVLESALRSAAEIAPELAGRIERVNERCRGLAASIPPCDPVGIHRDFYADQVVVEGSRLYLIDFDLYCLGDPALDIGNFVGHLTEQGLRTMGDPAALAGVERAVEERFLELTGRTKPAALRGYATLTLARHIYLSTRLPDRRRHTETMVELCEERLGLASGVVR